MSDYKIIWVNRDDLYGDLNPFVRSEKQIVISAESEGEALQIWSNMYPESAEFGASKCQLLSKAIFLEKLLTIKMPDGRTYGIPVEVIANNHASYYAPREFEGDIKKCLDEYTIPEFQSSNREIHDWAANNMSWNQVKEHALVLNSHIDDDQFEDAWCNAEYEIIELKND